MHQQGSQISCGVRQLYDLEYGFGSRAFHNLIKEKVDYVYADLSWGGTVVTLSECLEREEIFPAQYIFSDADCFGNGFKFMKFIRKNRLGKVTQGKTNINFNTKNKITTFIWCVDKVRVRKWYLEHSNKRGKYKANRKTK